MILLWPLAHDEGRLPQHLHREPDGVPIDADGPLNLRQGQWPPPSEGGVDVPVRIGLSTDPGESVLMTLTEVNHELFLCRKKLAQADSSRAALRACLQRLATGMRSYFDRVGGDYAVAGLLGDLEAAEALLTARQEPT